MILDRLEDEQTFDDLLNSVPANDEDMDLLALDTP
jgi:hypothetical protein